MTANQEFREETLILRDEDAEMDPDHREMSQRFGRIVLGLVLAGGTIFGSLYGYFHSSKNDMTARPVKHAVAVPQISNPAGRLQP